jgi:hypothetical protein
MSVLNPTDGPPRLIRYVAPGVLPSDDIVSLFNPQQNLLLIDKDNFDRLTPAQRQLVLHTTDLTVEINR